MRPRDAIPTLLALHLVLGTLEPAASTGGVVEQGFSIKLPKIVSDAWNAGKQWTNDHIVQPTAQAVQAVAIAGAAVSATTTAVAANAVRTGYENTVTFFTSPQQYSAPASPAQPQTPLLDVYLACARQGGHVDASGACITPQPVAPPPPQPDPAPQPSPHGVCLSQNPPGYWSNNQCYRSAEDARIDACQRDGNYWIDGACKSLEEYQRGECAKRQGTLADGTCYTRQDVQDLCEAADDLWVEGQCYVSSNDHVPRGLEGFYYLARTEQEKALLGAHREALNRALQEKNEAVQEAVDAQRRELEADHAAELDRIQREFEAELRGQATDFELLLQESRAELDEALSVNSVLSERLRSKYYYDREAPDGSLGALRSLLGISGASVPDVSFRYPQGFPDPRAAGDDWVVSVPLEITFPRVALAMGSMRFEADALAFTFQAGGRTTTQEVPLDAAGGGSSIDKVLVMLRASFPKAGAGNPALTIAAGLRYVESFAFESGRTYVLEGYREAPPLTRTFYTTATPFPGSRVTRDPILDATGTGTTSTGSVPQATGTSPGGAAAAYNLLEYQRSRASAAAQRFDQETGWGLHLLVQYWYVPTLAAGLALAYSRGWLDRFEAVQRFRRRGERSPDALLGDDLLGGL